MSRAAFAFIASIGLLTQTAQAADTLELTITLKNHVFEPKELKAAANQPILLTVINEDETPEEFESTALKIEKVVAAKSSIKLRIKGMTPARYEFVGEYNETAKGTLIVE